MSEDKIPGRPILSPGDFDRVTCSGNVLDARGAAAELLACFLRGVVFYRDMGQELSGAPFKLLDVFPFWPDPGQDLKYPTATVLDGGSNEHEAHSFNPTCLDETADQFGPNTVLWKTDELVCEFQVDFFTNDDPTREAILATLPGVFSPGEDRYGVVVEGTPKYFDRRARFTLLSDRRRDVASAVFDRERRIVCRVSAEIDVVVLRRVARFHPKISVDVTDASSSTEG